MGPIPRQEGEHDRPAQDENSDIEDAEHPDVIINADITESESDEEETDIGYHGYQALGQEITTAADSEDDDESSTGSSPDSESCELPSNTPNTTQLPSGTYPDFPNSENLPGYMQAPEMPRPEKKELLWNHPRHNDSKLDTGQVDKIKSVMSGFQLPSSNIPDWAKNLSDDQWQKQVVDRLVKIENQQEIESCSVNQSENKDLKVSDR